MRRRSSIPILLITGFLGAGKTSLLNHLLNNKQGFKVGVLVNDFGDINIDADLVSRQSEQTLELSNGCICCAVDDADLNDGLGQLAHEGSRLDYIIIEASGVANPRELATLVRLSPNRYSHFDTLVTVVDGANFAGNNKKSPEAAASLGIADMIIINKTDLISAGQLAEVTKAIKMVAPESRLLTSSQGQVDWRLLLDTKTSKTRRLFESLEEIGDLNQAPAHPEFVYLSFTTDKPLDPARFLEFSNNLPATVFRAKGRLFFGLKGAGQQFIFQAVGPRSQLKLTELNSDDSNQSQLLLIGLGFEPDKLRQSLDDLIDDQPDDVNAETLMDIFRYR